MSEAGVPDVPKRVENKNGMETRDILGGMIRAYLSKHYGKFVSFDLFSSHYLIIMLQQLLLESSSDLYPGK